MYSRLLIFLTSALSIRAKIAGRNSIFGVGDYAAFECSQNPVRFELFSGITDDQLPLVFRIFHSKSNKQWTSNCIINQSRYLHFCQFPCFDMNALDIDTMDGQNHVESIALQKYCHSNQNFCYQLENAQGEAFDFLGPFSYQDLLIYPDPIINSVKLINTNQSSTNLLHISGFGFNVSEDLIRRSLGIYLEYGNVSMTKCLKKELNFTDLYCEYRDMEVMVGISKVENQDLNQVLLVKYYQLDLKLSFFYGQANFSHSFLYENVKHQEKSEKDFKALAMAIPISFIIMFSLPLLCFCWVFHRRRKKEKSKLEDYAIIRENHGNIRQDILQHEIASRHVKVNKGKQLGRGFFGTVRLGMMKQETTGKCIKVAVKFLERKFYLTFKFIKKKFNLLEFQQENVKMNSKNNCLKMISSTKLL